MFAPWTTFKPKSRQENYIKSTHGERPVCCRLVTRTEIPRKTMSVFSSVQFSSGTQLCPTLCNPMNLSMPGLPVHHQLPEFTQTQRPLSRWCHPAISSSVVLFSSCPQSLLASESFPMSQHFAWGGHSTGVSALASFLPKKSQGWSPSEWTGWISLLSKGLSRVFSNTIVWKYQWFLVKIKYHNDDFSSSRSD